MTEIKDFRVGQKVFVRITGNAARGKDKDKLIEEWVVSKVGKKYVYAKPSKDSRWEVCFEKSESNMAMQQKTEYCVDYILYASKQEIEDEQEQFKLWKKISSIFGYLSVDYSISLDKLRRINAILEESGN